MGIICRLKPGIVLMVRAARFKNDTPVYHLALTDETLTLCGRPVSKLESDASTEIARSSVCSICSRIAAQTLSDMTIAYFLDDVRGAQVWPDTSDRSLAWEYSDGSLVPDGHIYNEGE